MPPLPTIPSTVTVHLGAPNEPAQNVTLSFSDYIKNVASGEIYPTWPENALRANIYAQISFALNRIYTAYYPSRGYAFDITGITQYDQSFVYGREVFENISRLVDELFDSYIQRQGSVEPLFAAYCDGVRLQCDGLSQWGTVDLAEQGLTPYRILQYYYGDDINIVNNVPFGDGSEQAPEIPLRLGSVGPRVQEIQIRLNRISKNYPAIPKIYPQDGIFGTETEEAVRVFQEVFSLAADGIVGKATWYKIRAIYNSVKRLNELDSEGLQLSEISTQYPEVLSVGSEGDGVFVLQYYLEYISQFVSTVTPLTPDGSFGEETKNSVISFQRTYGLTPDGVVGEVTWNAIYNVYLGLVDSVPLEYLQGDAVPFPGTTLRVGSSGEDVTLLQRYLNDIADVYTSIPAVQVNGFFDNQTERAVIAFQEAFSVPTERRGVVSGQTWDAIAEVYNDVTSGSTANRGQYPGYTIS